MATDLFVLVVCGGLSAQSGCTAFSAAGYYSQLACEDAKRNLVVVNAAPAHSVVGGNESDNRWTIFAFCRPGTPAEVRRWDKEGLGPQLGVPGEQ